MVRQCALLGAEGRCAVILANGVRERVVPAGAAKTRRVMLDSIVTGIRLADRDREQLALGARERARGEHQLPV